MKFADLADAAQAPGERRAALLVHAMSDADRRWVLDNLPDAQRAGLAALLDELADMQIAPDPSFLQHAIAKPPSPVMHSHRSGVADQDFLMELDGHGLHALAAALALEPAMLAARCLQIQPWPWREQLLQQFHAAHRLQVQALLDTRPGVPPPGSALGRALLKRMRECCEGTVPAPAAPSPAAQPVSALRRWPLQWAAAMRKLVHG